MGTEKPRQIAARILQRFAQGGGYVDELLEREPAAARLSEPDRRLLVELTHGLVRWQALLDWLIARKTDGRTQKLGLQVLLRLGLYQMFWLDRVPAYAAVHETVQLAKQLGYGAQAGFVNAVLRGYLRERSSTEAQLVELKRAQPALGYSHPEWLCQRWRERWGEEPLRRLLEWNNTPPPIYARLNTLRATPDQLTREWTREGVDHAPAPCRWTRPGLVYEVKRHPPLTTLPSFRQGFFYIQDPSTLLAVTVLQPQPGETVLDLCAAPGGKTTFLAQCMGNRGVIVASDPDPARRVQLRANCDRLGVTCVRWAETDADPNAPAPASFDRVLVDAPCSNTGVMRRRVELRWRIRPEELERLRRGQSGLLREAAARVEAGGTLVYSTCSLEPEENEQAVAEFLATQPGFRLEAEHRLAPFQDQVDGAYVAKLRREPRTSPCEE